MVTLLTKKCTCLIHSLVVIPGILPAPSHGKQPGEDQDSFVMPQSRRIAADQALTDTLKRPNPGIPARRFAETEDTLDL